MSRKFSSLFKNFESRYSSLSGKTYQNLKLYIKKNKYILLWLSIVIIAAYGFELFNFNITIDEEFYLLPGSNYSLGWIEEGRWGMYILEKLFLPHPVIPFISLGIALLFHLLSILILFKAINITKSFEKIIFGTLFLTYPAFAHIYMFSTIAYAIGFGLFLTSLSLLCFSNLSSNKKYYAILPAVFAISIYQPLIFTLLLIFGAYLLNNELFRENNGKIKFKKILIILLISVSLYFIIQQFAYLVLNIKQGQYITEKIGFNFSFSNIIYILGRIFQTMKIVYMGHESFYVYQLSVLGLLFGFTILGLFYKIVHLKSSLLKKFSLSLFVVFILILPFSHGFITQGYFDIRHLFSVSIVFSSFVYFVIRDNKSAIYVSIIIILVVINVFSFLRSTNYLFGLSHLTLQADRSLATRLINRIETLKSDSVDQTKISYIEIIGIPNVYSDEIIPTYDVFGASFFEWDQGNVLRIISFMNSLGFQKIEPLPENHRSRIVDITKNMPSWPAEGSIMIVDDEIVVIKFSPFSEDQPENSSTFEEWNNRP